jgi:cell pole-organizing protein PopZ
VHSLLLQRPVSITQLTLKLEYTVISTTFSMLARRACAHALNCVPASSALAARSRSFTAATATQSQNKAPSLADITPDSAATFNKKQQEFRDGIAAAQKQREQQESALVRSSFAHVLLLMSKYWTY